MPAKKTCFIVGPIGEAGSPARRLADWLLQGIFKPVLESEELGYRVKRADEDAGPGSITNALIIDIIEADLVIADLTGFNPNAFYELGIRHAIQKPTIHFIAERVSLPFDNKDQRTIFVDMEDYGNFEKAKVALRAAALEVVKDGYKVSNPVSQALALNTLQESSDPKDQVIASLESRIGRLERGIAEGIRGQGELATMSVLEAAHAIEHLRWTEGSGKSHIYFQKRPISSATEDAAKQGEYYLRLAREEQQRLRDTEIPPLKAEDDKDE